jgi:hypothetical protein
MGHTPIHAILLLCLAVSYSIMRIPSHVFYFSVASIGASLASFAVYETFAKPEEEKHKILVSIIILTKQWRYKRLLCNRNKSFQNVQSN